MPLAHGRLCDHWFVSDIFHSMRGTVAHLLPSGSSLGMALEDFARYSSDLRPDLRTGRTLERIFAPDMYLLFGL